MFVYRILQHTVQLVRHTLDGLILIDIKGRLPVGAYCQPSLLVCEVMSRQKLVHIPEKRLRSRNTSECHKVRQLLLKKLLLEIRVSQKRLDLRSKEERSVLVIIVKRLDSEMVSGSEKRLLRPVKDDKSEHPSQASEQPFLSPLLITVEQDLRISMRCKYMSCLDQLFPNVLKIVKLAVKNQHQILVLIEHRLRSAFQIDNAQTYKPQSDLSFYESIL